jgi:hypothetical protein
LLTAEIFFEEIDLIVLLNSFLGTNNEVFGGLRETKSRISVKLLLILSNICWLGVIELLRPTYINLNYFICFHASPFTKLCNVKRKMKRNIIIS